MPAILPLVVIHSHSLASVNATFTKMSATDMMENTQNPCLNAAIRDSMCNLCYDELDFQMLHQSDGAFFHCYYSTL